VFSILEVTLCDDFQSLVYAFIALDSIFCLFGWNIKLLEGKFLCILVFHDLGNFFVEDYLFVDE
jgi:hypothetical protein